MSTATATPIITTVTAEFAKIIAKYCMPIGYILYNDTDNGDYTKSFLKEGIDKMRFMIDENKGEFVTKNYPGLLTRENNETRPLVALACNCFFDGTLLRTGNKELQKIFMGSPIELVICLKIAFLGDGTSEKAVARISNLNNVEILKQFKDHKRMWIIFKKRATQKRPIESTSTQQNKRKCTTRVVPIPHSIIEKKTTQKEQHGREIKELMNTINRLEGQVAHTIVEKNKIQKELESMKEQNDRLEGQVGQLEIDFQTINANYEKLIKLLGE